MNKTQPGNFFEDFKLGQVIRHATPRTIHGGDLSLYIALTGDRRALSSSSEFARAMGLERELCPELLAFHMVFGKTVTDISLNAVANLGYADVRFLEPVYPGDTLRAESEVIGLRQTSKGDRGIVYVTTRGYSQRNREVLRFHRWVMVNKKDASVQVEDSVPELPKEVDPASLSMPAKLQLSRFRDQQWATGGRFMWEDYEVGERIVHNQGMTLEESDHMTATRLYQNLAKVHFNAQQMASSKVGKRLIYGGHIISVAYSLAYTGLENVLYMVAWNGGTHANPTVAGDTLYAFTEVLDKADVQEHDDIGLLRLRLIATKNVDPNTEDIAIHVENDSGKKRYNPNVVLDLDYWALVPKSN